jgi:putative CocE/NonD family hydrolase
VGREAAVVERQGRDARAARNLGQNQWRAAQAAPPSLVTIFPMVSSTSLYHDWITLNGGWRLSFNFGWGPVRQDRASCRTPGPHTVNGLRAIHYDQVQWHLPLNTMQQLVGRNARFYDDWIAHTDYDAYWKPLNRGDAVRQDRDPGAHVSAAGSTSSVKGTLRGYVGMSQKGATEQARKGSHIVIGPWGHGASQKYGALDFGAHANVDALPLQVRWYDYWLKGIDDGFTSEPPVKLYVMGRNEWVYEREYPLATHAVQAALLRERRRRQRQPRRRDGLTWTSRRARRRRIASATTPDDPVPSLGGNNCCGTPTPAGRWTSGRSRAGATCSCTTPACSPKRSRRRGPVKVVLYASSDAVDTDFVAKLVDVHPDGASYNMAEGILRARYRDSLSKPVPLVPGQVYKLEIDLVGTSVAFRPGHRIRVHVTSSHFPQFDRNPNTGAPFGTTKQVKVAQQTIYHDAERPFARPAAGDPEAVEVRPMFHSRCAAVLLSLCALAPSVQAQDRFAIPATDEGLPGAGPIRRYDWFQRLWRERRSEWARRVEQDRRSTVFSSATRSRRAGAGPGRGVPRCQGRQPRDQRRQPRAASCCGCRTMS